MTFKMKINGIYYRLKDDSISSFYCLAFNGNYSSLAALRSIVSEQVVKRLKGNLFHFNAELQLKEFNTVISNW